MKLTKEQKKNLELYLLYRDSPPTIWQLLKMNLWRYLLFAVLVGLLYLLAPVAGTESIPLLATGLFLGVLGRDVGYFLRFIRVWPATAIVLDWARVEKLLSEAT